jgi:hypothetical protein
MNGQFLIEYNIMPRDLLELLTTDDLTPLCQERGIKVRGSIIDNILAAYKDSESMFVENYEHIGKRDLNTLKTNAFLRVGCGNSRYSRYIGGRLCFPKDEVFRWLKITDGPEYLEYAKSCGITVIPEKYLRLAQKAKQSVGVKTC